MTPGRDSTHETRRFALLLAALVGVKILVHLLFNHRYGYHRDELYFLACADHLAAGYVDHAPGIGWITAFGGMLFGDSVRAIRFLPALAGGLNLLVMGLICRRLGGGLAALLLAGVALLMAPLFLRGNGMLNIVTFDQLAWTVVLYLVLRTLQSGNDRGWLAVGAAVGLGFLTKHTMIFLCFGLTVGILLTPHRKRLLSPYFWGGVAIAFLLFLPNLIWQIRHDWATLEFLRGLNASRMQTISPVEFLIGQVLYLGAFALPLWLAGLASLLLSRSMKPYRILGWTYLAVLAAFLAIGSKVYYLGPIYPMLFAAGGAAFERVFDRRGFRWGAPLLASFIALGGLVFAPLSLPVLSIEGFRQYVGHFKAILPNAREVGQDYYDMFGWEEMAEAAAEVYRSLSPEDRERTAILADNYGEAGAIDLFGPPLGLPKAHSGHNSYYHWGPPEGTVDILLTVGIDPEDLREACGSVEVVRLFSPTEPEVGERDVPICLCRGMRMTIQEAWPVVRHYE